MASAVAVAVGVVVYMTNSDVAVLAVAVAVAVAVVVVLATIVADMANSDRIQMTCFSAGCFTFNVLVAIVDDFLLQPLLLLVFVRASAFTCYFCCCQLIWVRGRTQVAFSHA